MEKDVVKLWRFGHQPFDAAAIIFNTFWYRFFNLDIHAYRLGMCDYETLQTYIFKKVDADQQVFTGAHIVRGIGSSLSGAVGSFKHYDTLHDRIKRGMGVLKAFDYLALAHEIWYDRYELAAKFAECKTLQQAFDIIQGYFLLGDFTSYELVCDLRWTLLSHCTDILTWGNVGNGAVRGLKRLGLKPTSESMVYLWMEAPEYLSPDVRSHHIASYSDAFVPTNPVHMKDYLRDWVGLTTFPPFEIREIEHSLCEFDKYIRAKSGQGRPRSKYDGR
jgi:hypothetical protein